MTQKKPIIGISVDCTHDPEDARTRGKLELNWNYAQAVSDAGGVPILIPPTADMDVIAPMIDGWLIPGGDDIDGSRFGQENHTMARLQDPARFEAEKALYDRIPAELPVLGICYGCQFLNVVRGGDLIQHLPDVVETVHTGGVLQSYSIEEGSKLGEAAAVTEMSGKSYHHQAVGKVGDALKIVAKCEDGTVEAVEATDRPWLIGVQWHPERTLEDSATQNLFREFIANAVKFANKR